MGMSLDQVHFSLNQVHFSFDQVHCTLDLGSRQLQAGAWCNIEEVFQDLIHLCASAAVRRRDASKHIH